MKIQAEKQIITKRTLSVDLEPNNGVKINESILNQFVKDLLSEALAEDCKLNDIDSDEINYYLTGNNLTIRIGDWIYVCEIKQSGQIIEERGESK